MKELATAVCSNVSFKSDRFDNSPKPHFVNPCCQCEEVAKWLQAQLQRHLPGYRVTPPLQEDFGWLIELVPEGEEYFFTVVIASFKQSEEDKNNSYGLYVIYDFRGSFVRRMFRKPQPPPSQEQVSVCEAIDAALHSESSIKSIQWWQDGFEVGQPKEHPSGSGRV